jgi:hypothetical protein
MDFNHQQEFGKVCLSDYRWVVLIRKILVLNFFKEKFQMVLMVIAFDSYDLTYLNRKFLTESRKLFDNLK